MSQISGGNTPNVNSKNSAIKATSAESAPRLSELAVASKIPAKTSDTNIADVAKEYASIG